MAIRDLFSNFKSKTDMVPFPNQVILGGGDTVVGEGLDMSIGTTGFIFATLTDGTEVSIIDSISVDFGNIGNPFAAIESEIFDATTNITGESTLGNTLIDLSTGSPIVFPYNVNTSGDLAFALSVNNPAETYQYVGFTITDNNAASGQGALMNVNAFVGPMRYVADDFNPIG